VLLQRPVRARTLLSVSALLGAAVSGFGCDRELPPATAVAVVVMTELSVEQVAQVDYKVFRSGDDPDYNTAVAKYTSPREQITKPFIITRAHADEFLLSVEGIPASGGDAAVIYRERVTFKAGKTLALPVFLANACYQRPCGFDDQTCYGVAYDGTLPGECERYPVRDLAPIVQPGDESKWVFVPTKPSLLDAGLRPGFPLDPDDYDDDDEDVYPRPTFDGGLTTNSCSSPFASPSCLPTTFELDASVPTLLSRRAP
jgi:hypothetical protein